MAASSGSSSSDEHTPPDPQVQINTASDDEPAGTGSPADPATATKKKKTTILREVAASEVRRVMNYKPEPFKADIPDEMIRCFPEMAAAFYIRLAETAPVVESLDRWMLERKEDFTRQLKAKGVVTYQVEVDDDYNQDKEFAPLHRGRRRHRPGVMKKHHGETRKLN